MSVSDCKEGQRLLSAASKAHPESGAREVFLEHTKDCPGMQRSLRTNPSMPGYIGGFVVRTAEVEVFREYQTI